VTGLNQSKTSCFTGKSDDSIAKRLMFLPPQACRVVVTLQA
jgi:hypothetical protein